ncbi:MAG: hypothetical protein LBB79_01295 [Prevotellaceae bacterium]|jgi:hypothetical protein|nr:hypothetical protein [Prevotellaceae bacterium]
MNYEKKLPFGLAIGALMLGIAACDKKACYTCVTTATYTGVNLDPVKVEKEWCDITEEDARNLESTSTTTSGTLTTTTVTKCTKK